MPAYSEPMISAGQMPHDDVTNPQSLNGHTGACVEEYVGDIDTHYTGTEQYYSEETSFVPVAEEADTLGTQSPVDDCMVEDTLTDKLVRCYQLYMIAVSVVKILLF